MHGGWRWPTDVYGGGVEWKNATLPARKSTWMFFGKWWKFKNECEPFYPIWSDVCLYTGWGPRVHRRIQSMHAYLSLLLQYTCDIPYATMSVAASKQALHVHECVCGMLMSGWTWMCCDSGHAAATSHHQSPMRPRLWPSIVSHCRMRWPS